MKKRISFLFLITLILFFVSACSKPEASAPTTGSGENFVDINELTPSTGQTSEASSSATSIAIETTSTSREEPSTATSTIVEASTSEPVTTSNEQTTTQSSTNNDEGWSDLV